MQFWKKASWGTFIWSNMKFGREFQEEMTFKEKVYGRRKTDARRTKKWSQYLTLSFSSGAPPPVRLSVLPSRYLLLNHCTNPTKFGVCVAHMNGECNSTFFWPHPLAPWGGAKSSNIIKYIKFQLRSQFQRFLNQILCVYSKMKDIKHIRWDFHSH